MVTRYWPNTISTFCLIREANLNKSQQVAIVKSAIEVLDCIRSRIGKLGMQKPEAEVHTKESTNAHTSSTPASKIREITYFKLSQIF